MPNPVGAEKATNLLGDVIITSMACSWLERHEVNFSGSPHCTGLGILVIFFWYAGFLITVRAPSSTLSYPMQEQFPQLVIPSNVNCDRSHIILRLVGPCALVMFLKFSTLRDPVTVKEIRGRVGAESATYPISFLSPVGFGAGVYCGLDPNQHVKQVTLLVKPCQGLF